MKQFDTSPAKRILIVAGEPSGDQHAAALIKSCHKQLSESIEFFAMGGKAMEQAGAQLLVPIDRLAVVGLTEVIKQLPAIRTAMKILKRWLADNQPDLVILVDYPGFNLRLADYAKLLKLKVLYYISPQIWAWRPQRIKRMQYSLDHMAVLFPFELPYYQKANIPVSLVPHPLLKAVHPSLNPEQLKQNWHLKDIFPIITLMPGSRPQELKAMLTVFYQTACLLKKYYPKLRCLLPLASGSNCDQLKAICPPIIHCSWITILEQQAYDALSISDVSLIASGTATLEAALLKIPMVVAYRTHWLSYWLAKRLLKLNAISLVNIIASRPLVPEYLQKQLTAFNLACAIEKLLQPQANQDMRTALHAIEQTFTGHPIHHLPSIIEELL